MKQGERIGRSDLQGRPPKGAPLPFQQALVLGGTGLTGHHLVSLLAGRVLNRAELSVVATSRKVTVAGLPAGPLAETTWPKLRDFDFVQWLPLDFSIDLAPQESSGPSTLDETIRRVDGEIQNILQALDPNRSTAVFLVGAYTNVEGCESDPDLSDFANNLGLQRLTQFLRKHFQDKAPLKICFFSTDYVFDGNSGPYVEGDRTNPLSAYGRAKWNFEQFLLESAENAALKPVILRTTGIFDYVPGSKNFLMQMLSLWSEGKPVKLPCDQISNPVWAYELALAAVEAVDLGAAGIYHCGGGESFFRDGFARAIAKAFDFEERADITGVTTASLQQKAARPLKSGLNSSKLRALLGWAPRPASTVLKEMKANLG